MACSRVTFGLLLGLALLTSCSERDDLQLIIDLRTDYVGGAEVNAARVSLFDSEGTVVIGTTEAVLFDEDLTQGLRIGELTGLTPGAYRLEVELSGTLSVPLRILLVTIEDATAVTVVITRDCRDVVCPMAASPALTQCVGGTCVDPTCTPETPESCPAAMCASDGDCASSVACASAVCIEGVCAARSDSASCAIGEYCEPTVGCVVQSCTEHDDCGRCARCGGTECEPLTFESISAGHQGVCAIDELGDRWCWGNNPGGELGFGDSGEDTARRIPRHADDGGDWASVRVGWGSRSGAGLRRDGTYWIWGGNEGPTQVGADTDWATVSVAGNNRVALRVDGRLWHNDEQLGTDSDWARATAGWNHSCAVKDDGRLFCWGSNEFGQIGTGMTGGTFDLPTQVGADADWLDAGGGEQTACGIRADGRIFCWGRGYDASPAQVGADTDWAELTYEWYHACGLKTDDSIWCFGGNGNGELGVGDTASSSEPRPIALAGPWRQLTVGGHFGCAYHEMDSRWYCWGASFGIGTGSHDDSPVPVALCPGP